MREPPEKNLRWLTVVVAVVSLGSRGARRSFSKLFLKRSFFDLLDGVTHNLRGIWALFGEPLGSFWEPWGMLWGSWGRLFSALVFGPPWPFPCCLVLCTKRGHM